MIGLSQEKIQLWYW